MAKILVIDDSALARRILKKFLEKGGHTILEASDGVSGLELFFIHKPDCVFLDLTMEGLHGLEVLEKIRKMDLRSPVVIATADIQDSTRKMAIQAGASAFLNKPFQENEVEEILLRVLRGGPE